MTVIEQQLSPTSPELRAGEFLMIPGDDEITY